MDKIKQLMDVEGYTDEIEMLEDAINDRFNMGICTNKDCDYTTEVEPDSKTGWCEICEMNTVTSCLMLKGMI